MSINLNNLNVESGDLGPADRPTALAINGRINAFSTYTTASNSALDFNNSVICQFVCLTGAGTVGTDTIGTANIALYAIQDSITGGILGFGSAGQAQICSLSVATGASVDSIAGCLFVSAIDGTSAGGTVNECASILIEGLVAPTVLGPGSYALNVDNFYAVKYEPNDFRVQATNNWGVWMGVTGSQNYFTDSINIGNPTQQVSNSSVALEVGNGRAIRLPNMTTGDMGALSALPGMIVFNTTGNTLDYYNGTDWRPVDRTASAQGGTATLSSGSITVSTATITASSAITFSYNTIAAGTPGILSAPTRSVGSPGSFTIVSTGVADNSTVDWIVVG